MSIIEIILLAIALAMDCFAVSIASGVIVRRPLDIIIVRMCLLFGLFQAAMPFFGWLCVNSFSSRIGDVAPWIAFALLFYLGVKMIRDAVKKDDCEAFNPLHLRCQLVLAVATSIDAFAVGVSLSCIGYTTMPQLIFPLTIIGIASLLLAMFGYSLGVRFGRIVEQRLKPELLGGIILIFIAIKVLINEFMAA